MTGQTEVLTSACWNLRRWFPRMVPQDTQSVGWNQKSTHLGGLSHLARKGCFDAHGRFASRLNLLSPASPRMQVEGSKNTSRDNAVRVACARRGVLIRKQQAMPRWPTIDRQMGNPLPETRRSSESPVARFSSRSRKRPAHAARLVDSASGRSRLRRQNRHRACVLRSHLPKRSHCAVKASAPKARDQGGTNVGTIARNRAGA
jgi:hypothetical protein